MSSCLCSFHMDLCFITANCSGVTHLDLRTVLAERGLAWRETSLKALCSEHGNLEILEISLTFVPSTLWIDSTALKPHFLAKTTWSTSFRPITCTPCNSQSGKNIKQHVTRTSIGLKTMPVRVRWRCPAWTSFAKRAVLTSFPKSKIWTISDVSVKLHTWMPGGKQAPEESGVYSDVFSKHTCQHFQLQDASSLWTLQTFRIFKISTRMRMLNVYSSTTWLELLRKFVRS